MMKTYRKLALASLLALFIAATSLNTKAASFTIVDGQIVTTQQTLNANETGIIDESILLEASL